MSQPTRWQDVRSAMLKRMGEVSPTEQESILLVVAAIGRKEYADAGLLLIEAWWHERLNRVAAEDHAKTASRQLNSALGLLVEAT